MGLKFEDKTSVSWYTEEKKEVIFAIHICILKNSNIFFLAKPTD